MSDAGPRPTADTGPLPSGPPNALVVDGILDGRVRDAQALREAVERLSTCGAGAFRLDITGGRFSLLPVETHVPPGAFDLTAQSDFLDRLHEVVQAAQDNSVEATLRCKLVYGAEVAETLFVVRGARVEPLTRRRPAVSGDAPALPTTDAGPWAGLQRRQLLLLAPLLLALIGLLAWQSGYVDRILAARAEQLTTETGPFDDMLEVRVDRSWGYYEVTVTRGAGYPDSPEALEARKASVQELAGQAACTVVGDGDDLFVQLLDGSGEVLTAERAELRSLLTEDSGEVVVKLEGRMAAATVRLSLDRGIENKK